MAKPSFYFSDGPYLQALQELVRALAEPEALVKLLGKARTGKSLLCEKLTHFLRHKGFRVVYFNYAIESPEMLRTMLARELDLPLSHNFSRMLEDVPLVDDDKPLILLFDDAHLLTDITLLEIYRLAQIQSGATRKLNIVLCGEPALEQNILGKRELQSLRMQMSHAVRLEPMSPEVVARFLLGYLGKVGMPGLQLEPAAQRYFYKCSRGYPGPVLELSQLIVAARQGSMELNPVSKAELMGWVQQAQDSSAGRSLPGRQLRETNPWVILGPLAAVLIVASLALLYRQLSDGAAARDAETLENTAVVRAATQPESPFRETAPAVSVPVHKVVASTSGIAVAAAVLDAAVTFVIREAEASVVSDSDLLLVTAAERGVAAADIAEPDFSAAGAASATLATLRPATSPIQGSATPVATPSSPTPSPTPAAAAPVTGASVTLVPAPDHDAPVLAVKPRESTPSEDFDTLPATDAAPAVVAETVRGTIGRWLTSWKTQDLGSYFAAYHPDFEPRYHSSRERWLRDRERVITNAGSIALELSDYRVIEQDDAQAEVQFWLAYSSPGYADHTLKKLVLARQGGRWLILEEVNLQVRG